MKKVLIVKANNRPDGVSTMMYNTFLESLNTRDDLEINTFDVFNENIPHYGQDLYDAFNAQKNNQELTNIQKEALEARFKIHASLKENDILVFIYPMWNLSVPSPLKAYIDFAFEAGFTFKYNADGSKKYLLGDKEVYLLTARGGIYSSEEMQAYEMASNLLKSVITAQAGFNITKEIVIEGHHQFPDKAEIIIESGLNTVKELAYKI